ncbi:MAG TPA: hypothetical protein VH643_29605 [Gemmataceae bacterium]
MLQYGFSRWRPPEGTLGSTAYQLDTPPSRHIVLWGYGLFYGDRADGGLFLKRFTFAPLWCPDADLRAALWHPEHAPVFRYAEGPPERTRLLRLLSGALRWIAEYESWILTTLGLEYRRQCLREWPKTVTEAENVPGQWLLLARACLENLELVVPNVAKERSDDIPESP